MAEYLFGTTGGLLQSIMNSLTLRKNQMTEKSLYLKLSSLPKELQKEVSDFIELLASKSCRDKKEKATKKRKRTFGCAKGFFALHPDFNSPIEDFREYR